MKQVSIIISSLLAIIVIGCSEPMTLSPVDQTWQVSITAVKGSDETKVLTDNGSTLSAAWTAGDMVYVTKNGTSLGTLTAKTSGTQTVLEGTLGSPMSLSIDDEIVLSYMSADYSEQNGTLAYISDHCDYAVATVSITSANGGLLLTSPAVFKNQQAITKFTFTDGTNTLAPTSLSINAASGKLVSKYESGTPQYGMISLKANNVYQTSFVLAMRNESGAQDTYTFTATIGSDIYIGTKKVNLTNGKYYTTSVTLSKRTSSDFVDMGLSVKWATCNLGASSPELMGDSFSWGMMGKATYLPANETGREYDYYYSSSYYELPFSMDAASQRYASEWIRMPTQAECEELVNTTNCKWEKTTLNGQSVYKVTSKINSNVIYIPLCGWWALGNYSFTGQLRLWSKTQCGISGMANSTDYAYALCVDSDNPNTPTVGGRYKPLGLPIRAVMETPVAITDITLNKTSIRIANGSYFNLTASVSPTNSFDKIVRWSSSNTSVATVDQNGQVTAVANGSATITVATRDGSVSATCAVTVVTSTAVSGSVDMGTGVYWATENLGNTSSKPMGDTYRWGETTAATQSGWSYYSLSDNSGNVTKYNASDGKTVLESSDDAAYKKLTSPSKKWYIPTHEEWTDLLSNCDLSYENSQFVLTSRFNGNKLYFKSNDDDSFYLWTSTVYIYNNSAQNYKYARTVRFYLDSDDDEQYNVGYQPRHNVFYIRPVYRP